MQAARNDERAVDEGLPDPRLNPMVNPRLGRNLGRWANVYYTTPPERREQAVLELVRELEGAQGAVPDIPDPESAAGDPVSAPEMLGDPAVAAIPAPQQRFCGHCGSPLKRPQIEAKEEKSSLALLPPLTHIGKNEDGEYLPSEPIETGSGHERPRARKHIVLVLAISAAIAIWSVWRIRADLAPRGVSHAVPISPQPAKPTTPSVSPVDGEVRRALVPVVRDPSPRLNKPSAGRPVGCADDHLGNCSVNELYGRTVSLANEIDDLFADYDKRVNRLLREASAHAGETAQQKQVRSRQANYSAQLWEHLQLGSYASHAKYAALKYRAELMRRATMPPTDRKMIGAYENPRSCLELHYIAADLRKLAVKMRQPRTPIRASRRRVASVARAR